MPVSRQHPVGEDASGATVPVSERWMRSQVAWWVATASIATLSKPGSSGRGRLRHRCVEAGEGALQAGLKRLEVLCRLRSELAARSDGDAPPTRPAARRAPP